MKLRILSSSKSQWFAGMQHAENIYQQYGIETLEDYIAEAFSGFDVNQFDYGMRDYLHHLIRSGSNVH